MKVLIACEESGIVRRAFRGRGHVAFSCDLLPAADGDHRHHVRRDVLRLIEEDPEWDLMIAHPPCTHLAGSGARWLTDHWVKSKKSARWHDGTLKRRAQVGAVDFVRKLWDAPIPRIAIENPVGMLPALWMPWTQVIQPWQFGHGESKKTCLWLKGLAKLTPTDIVTGREQRIWKMAPGPNREKLRSRTYLGIADAMATQWGGANKITSEGCSMSDAFTSNERLLQVIETGLAAMRDCQRNAHGGKVCFDGDEWHERWALLSEARRVLRSAVETTTKPNNLALQKGANMLWARQFKGTPWEGKVGLINPESMEEYRALALQVWTAIESVRSPVEPRADDKNS